MSTSEQTSEVQTSAGSRVQGRVKWFNNKSGYGFITLSESDNSDVFVHHSALSVGEEQYKYLVQGEYVEFEMSRVSGGSHEWQASNVRGLHGGKLMCETRHDARVARVTHASQQSQPASAPTQVSAPQTRPVAGGRGGGRGRGAGGRGNWVLVRNKGDVVNDRRLPVAVEAVSPHRPPATRPQQRRRPQLARQDSS